MRMPCTQHEEWISSGILVNGQGVLEEFEWFLSGFEGFLSGFGGSSATGRVWFTQQTVMAQGQLGSR